MQDIAYRILCVLFTHWKRGKIIQNVCYKKIYIDAELLSLE